jgi:hypothetical protein
MSGCDAIVRSIDEEIERLQRARALVTGHTAPLNRGPHSKRIIAASARSGPTRNALIKVQAVSPPQL